MEVKPYTTQLNMTIVELKKYCYLQKEGYPLVSLGDMSMDAEAIKTSIFHVTPVRKNA